MVVINCIVCIHISGNAAVITPKIVVLISVIIEAEGAVAVILDFDMVKLRRCSLAVHHIHKTGTEIEVFIVAVIAVVVFNTECTGIGTDKIPVKRILIIRNNVVELKNVALKGIF